jgi:hypothetical protein
VALGNHNANLSDVNVNLPFIHDSNSRAGRMVVVLDNSAQRRRIRISAVEVDRRSLPAGSSCRAGRKGEFRDGRFDKAWRRARVEAGAIELPPCRVFALELPVSGAQSRRGAARIRCGHRAAMPGRSAVEDPCAARANTRLRLAATSLCRSARPVRPPRWAPRSALISITGRHLENRRQDPSCSLIFVPLRIADHVVEVPRLPDADST